jgi:cysteinyl-tRNA synthetase
MHNGYINVDNVKMSKSLGNFFMVRDILKEFDAETVRLLILSIHYRNPLNFSDGSLEQSQNALERLYNVKKDLLFRMDHASNRFSTDEETAWLSNLTQMVRTFENAMEDDLTHGQRRQRSV